MNYKHLFYSAAIIVYLFTSAGCANIVAPTGGPRDSLPPVLLSATPRDSARHFTGNRIHFVFNEYVEVQNIQQNLVVSPTPLINPVIEYKLRTVTIKLKDTLEANTTYAINFGNALRDINEGNVLNNFTYVFSTGAALDSSTFSGRVLLAETGKADSTLIALLHRNDDDSAVAKERPRYYAKLDSSGRFTFRFLAPGSYSLYALGDEGGSRRYTSPGQLFAFAPARITIDGATEPVTLYAYVEKEQETRKPVPPRPAATRSKKEEDKRLKFQVSLDNGQQDILDSLRIAFNDPLKTFDSTKLVLADEQFNRVPGYSIRKDSTNQLLILIHAWKENTTYNLILDKDFASDSTDRKLLKTDTILFKTKRLADYGSLRLRFPSIDLASKPVLQFVQNDKIVISHTLTTKEYYNKLMRPGEYELRILFDTNGNGVWDPGQFFGKHLQPEHAETIGKKLVIRANWDNEMNVTVNGQ